MFKNETHNHPTEIEPFGGAATCLGGAIRDPLSGRCYVYQAMRVTGAGDPTAPLAETLPGKLPQRKIVHRPRRQATSSYGNQIGLATGLVHEIYHPGYVAKRMEIGAVVGAAPAENVVREVPRAAATSSSCSAARTGRDGCGGATGSSKAHTEQSARNLRRGGPEGQRRPRSASSSACSATAKRHPHDQALQRLRRGRRFRCHRRAGRRSGHRPERRTEEVRRSGRHRACHLRIAGAHGRCCRAQRTRTRSLPLAATENTSRLTVVAAVTDKTRLCMTLERQHDLSTSAARFPQLQRRGQAHGRARSAHAELRPGPALRQAIRREDKLLTALPTSNICSQARSGRAFRLAPSARARC